MKHIYFFLSILLVCTSCTQKKTPAREFLRGGDISSLTYLENSGVQFADAQGTAYPLGYLYWDPILVEQKHDGQWLPIGWGEDGNNDVGNTTWFDYEGKALPILDAIRLHAEQADASWQH